jgi:DNA-binding XRE family transcriptional regulator
MKEITSHNIRILKARKGISSYRLIIDTGLNKHTFKNLEYGNCEPKCSQAIKLSEYFGIDIKQFLTIKLN